MADDLDRSLGDLARDAGVPIWQMRRWYDSGELGLPRRRVAGLRTIRSADYPTAVERARELAKRRPAAASA